MAAKGGRDAYTHTHKLYIINTHKSPEELKRGRGMRCRIARERRE